MDMGILGYRIERLPTRKHPMRERKARTIGEVLDWLECGGSGTFNVYVRLWVGTPSMRGETLYMVIHQKWDKVTRVVRRPIVGSSVQLSNYWD